MNTLTGLFISAGLPSGSGNSAEREKVEATITVAAERIDVSLFVSFMIYYF
jgi:hypothetical protein